VFDPYDLKETRAVIREELAAEEPSVVISRRPCVLLKSVKRNPPMEVIPEKCVGCKACMGIGCPAIRMENNKASIDATQCVGCKVCAQLCGTKAIVETEAKV
jgi:indolepyruvate ferredoxin oxidoreductase alpha subunit